MKQNTKTPHTQSSQYIIKDKPINRNTKPAQK